MVQYLADQEGGGIVADTYDNITVELARGRQTAKWNRYGEDVLGAWVAEMDYPLADPIKRALEEAIGRGAAGYPVPDSESGLPVAITNWTENYTGMSVDPGNVRIVPDILRGMIAGIEAFSPTGSPVIVTTPSYPPFFEVVRASERPMIEVPMLFDEAGRASFDLDGLDRAFAANAKTLILCNPYNPLGRVFTKDELSAVASLVESHHARVIADEVHSPLVYPAYQFTAYSTVSEAAAAHSITLLSASKGWNVPGLKCAVALLTNDDDPAKWDELSRMKTHGASILGIIANVAAFREGQSWLHHTVDYLDDNRELLGELIAEHLPSVRYWKPEGTYLSWLDCRALGLNDPMTFFLDEAHVAVNDGNTFGSLGIGFIRLNFATSKSILTRIITQMGEAVRQSRR